MNIFALIRKSQKDKKSTCLDLRKTQSSPVIVIRNTPADLKPILTNLSKSPISQQDNIEIKDDHATPPNSNNSDNARNNNSFNKTVQPIPKSDFTSEQQKLEKEVTDALAEKLRVISADDMEVLLSMETQARMDHLEERQERQKVLEKQQHDHHAHPKRLKFSLPETPLREPTSSRLDSSISHAAEHQHDYSPIEKRWSLPEEAIRQDMKKKSKLSKPTLASSKWTRYLIPTNKSDTSSIHPSSGSSSTDHHNNISSIEQSRRAELRYGSKVKLIRSPIRTTAYVRYIGPVHFAPGEWVGVELERAVGKTDGSVDGERYFFTEPYRGSFLTKDELMIV